MKTLYLLIFVLLTPFILNAQTEEVKNNGFRAGINLSPMLFGEYGFTFERYFGNKSIYFSFAYKTEKQFNNMDIDDDYYFNSSTYNYLPSKGIALRLGYKFKMKKDAASDGLFIMPELIFRQDGFDHFTFYKENEQNFEQTYSMCGKRYGAAFKFGWQNHFKNESPIYWELNFAFGALYRNDNFMLYYSKDYTETEINKLYNQTGFMPTYAFNIIFGYDFNK